MIPRQRFLYRDAEVTNASAASASPSVKVC